MLENKNVERLTTLFPHHAHYHTMRKNDLYYPFLYFKGQSSTSRYTLTIRKVQILFAYYNWWQQHRSVRGECIYLLLHIFV